MIAAILKIKIAIITKNGHGVRRGSQDYGNPKIFRKRIKLEKNKSSKMC